MSEQLPKQKIAIKEFSAGLVIILIAIVVLNNWLCNPKRDLINYTIESTDSTYTDLKFRIKIPSQYQKDTLIKIANQLKKERLWDDKLVCFFYLEKQMINETAWASVVYLPNCEECTTDYDEDGNGLKFQQILNN